MQKKKRVLTRPLTTDSELVRLGGRDLVVTVEYRIPKSEAGEMTHTVGKRACCSSIMTCLWSSPQNSH